MEYDPQKHHRRSIRLKGYDYSQPGAYFVTLCAQNQDLLFDPDPAQEMIQLWWDKLHGKFTFVQTDAFVIMPNHIHGIIVLGLGEGDNRDSGEHAESDKNTGMGGHMGMGMGGHVGPPRRVEMGGGQSRGSAPTEVSLAEVVQWFKTMTTNEYIRGVKQLGWQPFQGRLWQRNYYEHIIRNEIEWNQIRDYIHTNPMRWQEDKLYPCTPSNRFTQE